MPSRQIVVTLTRIPTRFARPPRKLASIRRQTQRPNRLEHNLLYEYRRFPGPRPAQPALPDWVETVETDADLGPATKLMPAAQRWRGTPTDLLLCDDDRLQDRHWLARFVACRVGRSDDLMGERGWNFTDIMAIPRPAAEQPRAMLAQDRGRSRAYRLQRIVSLALCHPPRKIYASAGYADVFEGFLGALVPADAFPEMALQIPAVVWTVDDVWLSGRACHNGTRVWVNALPRPVYANTRFDKGAALTDHVEQGVNRDNADRLAVEYPRREYGVWP